MVDIHTHILPNLDDGSQSIKESLELLQMMSDQGITKIFATPHFYPEFDNLYDFNKAVTKALNSLNTTVSRYNNLPEIYIGCEMLYYPGIGDCDTLTTFCYELSSVLLLELNPKSIDTHLFEDILKIKNIQKITPIIAHVERYANDKNFSKLIRFIKKENIPTQINANSVLENDTYKIIKKLIKKNVITYIASDTHSLDKRPPKIKEALAVIEKDFGKEYTDTIIKNSQNLFQKIVLETDFNDKNQ